MAVLVGGFCDDSAELGVVVNLELHRQVGLRLAVFVHYRKSGFSRFTVVVDHIDFGEIFVSADNFFRAVIVAKYPCVKEQGARCRLVEPTQIEYGLWLAGTEEMPMSIHVSLYPSVVVITMCPTGRIDLSCRDANGAQGGD